MGTTANGYPYPEDSDPVAQGAQAIKSLATTIDNRFVGQRIASGQVTVNVPSAGGNATLAVTFPAGRFTTAPVVVMSGNTTGPQNAMVAATAVTATGFTANAYRATAGNTGGFWIAVG